MSGLKPALRLLQGKRIQDVAFRMHVAQPKPRDRQGRPPVIPPGLTAQRARKDSGEKMRTEKDVEVGCRSCLTHEPLHMAWHLAALSHGKPGSDGDNTTYPTCFLF